MAHIKVREGLPGILGLLDFRPETAKPLSELAEVLLRGPSPLSPGERELIAAHVSYLNRCKFCHNSHRAAARALLGEKAPFVDAVKTDLERADLSEKMKALLQIAAQVTREGAPVSAQEVTRAREGGASDQEIHDTVLIAAAFCMYNKYVDGLGTWAPDGEAAYQDIGKHLAENGYLTPRTDRRNLDP